MSFKIYKKMSIPLKLFDDNTYLRHDSFNFSSQTCFVGTIDRYINFLAVIYIYKFRLSAGERICITPVI